MFTLHTALLTVLWLNFLWFSAAFQLFSLKPKTAANILIPRSSRESPLFEILAASVRFLGGMNFAFATFSLLLLFNLTMFPEPRQASLFCSIFAVAHGSQFYFNASVVLEGRRKRALLWPVLSGPMRSIFVIDLTLAVANAGVSIALLLT